MSRDYHATEFIGRLAADPDTKYGEANGTARTRFRVLVNEEWKESTAAREAVTAS